MKSSQRIYTIAITVVLVVAGLLLILSVPNITQSKRDSEQTLCQILTSNPRYASGKNETFLEGYVLVTKSFGVDLLSPDFFPLNESMLTSSPALGRIIRYVDEQEPIINDVDLRKRVLDVRLGITEDEFHELRNRVKPLLGRASELSEECAEIELREYTGIVSYQRDTYDIYMRTFWKILRTDE